MDKLRATIQQYGRWQAYDDYIKRIELNIDSDFPACVEISKSLLEGIAKKICEERGQPFEREDNVGKLVKLAFGCIGYDKAHAEIQKIGTALVTIGHNMGTLRNAIGPTAHGVTPEEIEERKSSIKKSSSDFLMASTEMVCCFLIQAFETEFPRKIESEQLSALEAYEDFNEFWDEQYGEFVMGDYAFLASEVLYHMDPVAYKTELTAYKASQNETNN